MNLDCNNYNQYNSEECFKGSTVYPLQKSFNINNYLKYKSKDYYSWINNNFSKYSFPNDYSTQTFNDICENSEYSLKPQQKFIGRIMNTSVDNTGLLIYHGLGSGKTQTSIIIGEAFKFRTTKNTIINNRTDSHVLIVVPASLVDQYYNEIIGNIENGIIKSASGEILINGNRQYYLDKLKRIVLNQHYTDLNNLETELTNSKSSVEDLKNKIIVLKLQILDIKEQEKKDVKKVYEILSHDTFLNRIMKIENGKFIEGEYLSYLKRPNGLLIIDEVQNLVSAEGSTYRRLLFALKYSANPNFRVVLLTGTPIYDKPFEFGLMLNLLRPRIPFPDGYENFNKVFIDNNNMINTHLFKQMCSGYISYFKGGNPETYPYKKTIIMRHAMNPYQYSIYKDALFKEIEKDQQNKIENREEFIFRIMSSEKNNDEATTSVFNNSRLFCNITFPEVPKQNNLSRDDYAKIQIAEFSKILLDVKQTKSKLNSDILKTVSEYSSKFAKVAELIEMSEGPVFVYSNYVPYGVDAMAIVMKAIGYKEYPSKGKKSYFIWKGKADKNQIINAKKIFNSEQNHDGSLLKIMFGTQTVMEGVDFKRVRQIHILDPWWNDSRMQQIIARGIRFCSHKGIQDEMNRSVDVFIHLSTIGSGELLYSIKYNALENGSYVVKKTKSRLQRFNDTETDPSKWMFYESYIAKDGSVKETKNIIYSSQILNIVKIPDPILTRKFGSWKQLDSRSVEEYMWSRALNKLYINRQFEKNIKEVSIDCNINKKGNIIRLEEKYISDERNLFHLEYENYSSGEIYTRLGIKSNYNSNLEDNILTIQDIFNNTARKSNLYNFKNNTTGEVIKLNKSLIISENINCNDGDIDYSFNPKIIPSNIIKLTLNKELIPYLLKLKLQDIKQYFFDVEKGNVIVSDPLLKNKVKKYFSKNSHDEKQEIVKKLYTMGIGVDTDIWNLYTIDELKKITAKLFISK